jgi:branched-chain amino acid transport system substrate-binding protein
MREMGLGQPYLACDRCVSDRFLEIAGENANGVVCAYPWNPMRSDSKLTTFREAFRKRFDEEPETYAAHGYDGMNLLIWAIQHAGLNRAKIRDLVAHRPRPFEGVTGTIRFSAVLDDLGEVYFARVEDGTYRFYSRMDWNVPRGTANPRDRAARKTVAP